MSTPLPPEIEAIVRLVQIDGNNNLAKLLRDYIESLIQAGKVENAVWDPLPLRTGEPGDKVHTNDEVPTPILNSNGIPNDHPGMPFIATAGESLDTMRLDVLEELAVPSGKTKRRIQIFFEGTLRDWIDTKAGNE